MANLINLKNEATLLAERLFKDDSEKRDRFTKRLLDICELVKDKDILLIHNPGGWGITHLENLLQWERSIVEGVSLTMGKLGYKWALMQYFRSDPSLLAIIKTVRDQLGFFVNMSKIMAAELEFVTRHFNNLQVVMIGVSMGAAFNNAVSQNLNGFNRVSSIELGLPFPYKSKRVLTDRTLALDSNGLMPDALMEWDVPTILKTYLSAPFRWIKYKLQGRNVKFTYCINLPGHDYNWDYPEVQRQIEEFLTLEFGRNISTELEV